MSLKVYLASSYSAKDALVTQVVPLLTAHDHQLTSSWLHDGLPVDASTTGTASGVTDTDIIQIARGAVQEVAGSQVLVHVTPDWILENLPGTSLRTTSSGGRFVEIGVALGHGIPVIHLGEPENVFTRSLPQVTCATIEDLLEELTRIDSRS